MNWRIAPTVTASELARDLGLDAGYPQPVARPLSEGPTGDARKRSAIDGRQSHLGLTAKRAQCLRTSGKIGPGKRSEHCWPGLSGDEQSRLVGAMHTIEALLNPVAGPAPPL